MNDYFCGFCLEVVRDVESRPDKCPACKVYRCVKCQTWLKGEKPRLCFGCGLENPAVKAAMFETESIVGVYAVNDWHRRNRDFTLSDGFYSMVTSTQPPRYTIRRWDGSEPFTEPEYIVKVLEE